MRKKIRAGIALLLAGLTTCFAGACVNENAEKEKLALQQRLEELQQQNASMKAEKESLQQQFDELNGLNQTVLDELKGLEDTIYGSPLESGFYKDYVKNAWYENSGEMVALKSDRSRFDIDDVTLDLYLGNLYMDSNDVEMYGDRFFDIYFTIGLPGLEVSYFAKHVEESFYSEEYKVKEIGQTNHGDFIRHEHKFNKYHTVTIPKEIFIGNAGRFYVSLRFADANEEEKRWPFFGATLYYKIEYDKVVISTKQFEEWVGESYLG